MLSLLGSIEEPIGVNTLSLLLELGVPEDVSHIIVTVLPDERDDSPIVLFKCVMRDDSPIGALDACDGCPPVEVGDVIRRCHFEPPGRCLTVDPRLRMMYTDWPIDPPWDLWTAASR